MGTAGDEATTLPSAAGAGPQLARGQAIGRYLVLEAIGSGSMGVVYSAWDPSLDRKVALKLVRRTGNDETLDARLLREAKALARLAHPNVVAVHDAGTHDAQVFLAMEFVDGVTLGQWLQQQPRTWQQALAVFIGAGEGLAAAHRAQLVHRDFKPDNVLVEPTGRARVTDFGLARDAGASATLESTVPRGDASAFVTREGSLTGTPAYMSPEQFRGQGADARSDQFSFCIALYEALWGRRPFEGKSLGELEAAVLQGRLIPPPPSKVPRRIREAVLRGLSTEPSARHPNLEALLDELQAQPLVTTGRAVIGVAVLAALVAGGALWSRESKLRCTGAETKLHGVWDAERRRLAEAAFVATKAPGAESAAQRAFDALDAYASAWVTMHGEACRATRVTGEQSEAVMDRRMRCLARRRDELDAQAALFEKATPEIVARAAQAAGALSVLAPCADLDALKEQPALENAALASRVAELRRAVADVKALKNSGRYAKAIERAEALLPEVRTLGYQPLLAELLVQLGDAQEPAGQIDAAEKSFEAAVFEAEACRHDEVVALASVRLVLVTGARRGKPEAAGVWEKHASAAIARLGRAMKANNGTMVAARHSALARMRRRPSASIAFAALAVRCRCAALFFARSTHGRGNTTRLSALHDAQRAASAPGSTASAAPQCRQSAAPPGVCGGRAASAACNSRRASTRLPSTPNTSSTMAAVTGPASSSTHATLGDATWSSRSWCFDSQTSLITRSGSDEARTSIANAKGKQNSQTHGLVTASASRCTTEGGRPSLDSTAKAASRAARASSSAVAPVCATFVSPQNSQRASRASTAAGTGAPHATHTRTSSFMTSLSHGERLRRFVE